MLTRRIEAETPEHTLVRVFKLQDIKKEEKSYMFLPKIEQQLINISSSLEKVTFVHHTDEPFFVEEKKAKGVYYFEEDQIFICSSRISSKLEEEIVLRHEIDHRWQNKNQTLKFGFNPEDFVNFGWLRFAGSLSAETKNPVSHSHLFGYLFIDLEFEVWCRDYLHFCFRKNLIPEDFEKVKKDPDSFLLADFNIILEALDNITKSRHFNESLNKDLIRSYQPGWLIKEIKKLWW